MNFLKSIPLAKQGNVVGKILLDCSLNETDVSISYQDNLSNSGKKSGPSFFYVLAEIREEYSEQDIFLLCKGAQKSVFPGGLTSESTHGEVAYEIIVSQDNQSVVNIFENIDISNLESIVSLDEQKANRRLIIRKKNSPDINLRRQ